MCRILDYSTTKSTVGNSNHQPSVTQTKIVVKEKILTIKKARNIVYYR